MMQVCGSSHLHHWHARAEPCPPRPPPPIHPRNRLSNNRDSRGSQIVCKHQGRPARQNGRQTEASKIRSPDLAIGAPLSAGGSDNFPSRSHPCADWLPKEKAPANPCGGGFAHADLVDGTGRRRFAPRLIGTKVALGLLFRPSQSTYHNLWVSSADQR
jgi:hypothetical protein